MTASTKPNPEPASDIHPDSISGPGAHPVGTGLGAAGGAALGAAIGAMGGPVGAIVGAALGGVAGGLAGKDVAELIDPTAEDAYWRAEHGKQDYAVESKRPYGAYAEAYRVGYQGAQKYALGTQFDEISEELRREFETPGGPPQIDWEDARPSAKRAWGRVERGEALRLRTREEM